MVLGLRELEVGRGGGGRSYAESLIPQAFKGLCSLEPMAGLSGFYSHRDQVTISEGQKAMLHFTERATVTHTKTYLTPTSVLQT